MANRKPVDLELARQKLKDMPPSEARDAFELLIEHAAQLPGWECGAAQKGYFTDFRYYTPTEHPFAFIINKGSLRWYFRAPAGLRSQAANMERLRQRFAEVDERRDGTIAVQLRTVEDAVEVIGQAFSAPPFATVTEPRIYSAAHLKSMARELAGTYAFATDDGPLHAARRLAAYSPGEAAAISAAMTDFLPEGRMRERFAEFLLEVAHGKIRSVFAGYRD